MISNTTNLIAMFVLFVVSLSLSLLIPSQVMVQGAIESKAASSEDTGRNPIT